MISDSTLIEFIHSEKRSNRQITLALLASLGGEATVGDISAKATDAGIKKTKINFSDVLAKSNGMCVRRGNKWQMLKEGWDSVRQDGLLEKEQRILRVASSLRELVDSGLNQDRKRFLDEALLAFESNLYRAAIVLSWVGAVHILQEYIIANHLRDFNSALASRFSGKHPKIKNIESFNRLKEQDMLQLCEDAGIFGKAIKQELEDRLGLRNRAGHPNPNKFQENMTAAHLEWLIIHVYREY